MDSFRQRAMMTGTRHARLLGWGKCVCILAVVLLAVSSLATNAGAQASSYSLQVGAWGDDASRGNVGVRSDMRTSIYAAESSDLDYFWVGDNLEAGAFIQFGFSYEPGYRCLKGEWRQGELTCSGGLDNIGASDARWQWQYWPDALVNDFYYEIGPANSAGENGGWHTYSILPDSSNSWSFLIDGLQVADTQFHSSKSMDAVYAIAEKVTGSPAPGTLGPVEFKNLSYLKDGGWHPTDTLYVAEGCSVNPCTVKNTYGVALEGPNHIIAGSGLEKRSKGEFLWTSSYATLSIRVHPGTSMTVTSIFGIETVEHDASVKVPRGMYVVVTLMNERAATEGFLGLVGAVDSFQSWTGATTETSTSFRALMTDDKQVQTAWTTDYTVPILGVGIVLVAILVTVCILVEHRRTRSRQLTLDAQQYSPREMA